MKPYLKIFVCKFFLVIIINNIFLVSSHGRLMEPLGRGSRWRYNASAPRDYNDNEGFCGGFFKQWHVHKGKCGLCGDDFGNEVPRAHELNGIFGEGIIVNNYKSGSEMNISVYITANHKGYFIFDLCNLDKNIESEECFLENPMKLVTGEDRYYIKRMENGWFNTTIKIPTKISCQHCVFRWTYITGNSWGTCDDNTEALGCGPQENFKGCSDISIQVIYKIF